MSDAVEDALRQIREGTYADDAEPAAPAAVVETETAAPTDDAPVVVETTPEPPQKSRFALDDVILDDLRLPESLRNQPATVLAEDRKRAIAAEQQANFKVNRLEAENGLLTKTLEQVLTRFGTPEPKAEPPKTRTPIDRIRERGIEPTDLYSNAADTLSTTIEAGADYAEERIRPQIESVDERVKRLEAKEAADAKAREDDSFRAAFQAARPASVSQAEWDNDYSGQLSSFALVNRLPLNDPETYRKGAAWVDGVVERRLAARNPAPAVPDTPASAPAAPAPPVGTGRPAAPPVSKPSAHLNNHERAAFTKVTDIFKKIAPSLTVDDILNDAKADPKTRSAFP